VSADLPLVVSGNVAPATHRCGDLYTWPDSRVIRIRGMVARHSMTVLALDTFKLWSGSCTRKTSRHTIADRVANQTTGIRLLIILLQGCEGLRMGSLRYRTVDWLMAFNAVLPTGIMWCWTGNAE